MSWWTCENAWTKKKRKKECNWNQIGSHTCFILTINSISSNSGRIIIFTFQHTLWLVIGVASKWLKFLRLPSESQKISNYKSYNSMGSQLFIQASIQELQKSKIVILEFIFLTSYCMFQLIFIWPLFKWLGIKLPMWFLTTLFTITWTLKFQKKKMSPFFICMFPYLFNDNFFSIWTKFVICIYETLQKFNS